MITIGPKYNKLKTSLQLARTRFKVLQAKQLELSEKLKMEIAKCVKNDKYMNAKIKVQKVIRDDASVEAMEIAEMLCEQILDKYDLFQQMREPDVSLIVPISSLIWVAPYFQNRVPELKVIMKQLSVKYGNTFCRSALKNANRKVFEELIDRVRFLMPSNDEIEQYLKDICNKYGVVYDERSYREKRLETSQLMKDRCAGFQNTGDTNLIDGNTEFQAEGVSQMSGEMSSKKAFTKIMSNRKTRKADCKDRDESRPNSPSTERVSNTNIVDATHSNEVLNNDPKHTDEHSPTAKENKSDENCKIPPTIEKFKKEKEDDSDDNKFPLWDKYMYSNGSKCSKLETSLPIQPHPSDNGFNIYPDPPPPYDSLCFPNKRKDQETELEYCRSFNFPSCPSKEPDDSSSSENDCDDLKTDNEKQRS